MTINDNLVPVQDFGNNTNNNIQQNIVFNEAIPVQENVPDLPSAYQHNITSDNLTLQPVVVNTDPPVISDNDLLIHDPPTLRNESILPPVNVNPVYEINKIIKQSMIVMEIRSI